MFKSWFPESRDLLPLTWWKQHPVYLAAILAIIGAISMVAFAILGPAVMGHLVFSVDAAFTNWHLWTPFTYAFVNPPSLWIVFGCYLLWRFGEAVERHFGRRIFVKLLMVLLVVSPIFITLLHIVGFRGMSCSGMMQLEFGVFIAFATLYPRAKISIIILTLDAWVLAAIIVGVSALASLAARDWASLLLLGANVGAAYTFIRFEKGELSLPTPVKIVPKSGKFAPKPGKAVKSGKSTSTTVDDILDKISQNGIESLTDEERRILEKASGQK